MTQNQIAYSNFVEARRHNLATELETNRSNVATLGETNRHNVYVEQESTRHNKSTEDLSKESNAINSQHFQRMDSEATRHNQEQENIQRDSLVETRRHNTAQEEETARHNVQQENVNARSLYETSRHNIETEEIQSINANAAAKNANTNFLEYAAHAQDLASQQKLRTTQISDLESQSTARKINTLINVVKSGPEMAKDSSIAFKNLTNAVGDAIKSVVPVIAAW